MLSCVAFGVHQVSALCNNNDEICTECWCHVHQHWFGTCSKEGGLRGAHYALFSSVFSFAWLCTFDQRSNILWSKLRKVSGDFALVWNPGAFSCHFNFFIVDRWHGPRACGFLPWENFRLKARISEVPVGFELTFVDGRRANHHLLFSDREVGRWERRKVWTVLHPHTEWFWVVLLRRAGFFLVFPRWTRKGGELAGLLRGVAWVCFVCPC